MPELVLISSSATKTTDPHVGESLKKWQLEDSWQQRYVTWNEIIGFLKDVVFRQAKADIVEVGTTWISSYVGMNALRPFSASETERIQHEGNFLPIAWNSSMPRNDNQIWSIPWSADVRIMYYWKDMFEDAGVDTETAFRDPASFEAALERLQAHGIETPWVDTTDYAFNSVYRAGMWIWQHGGDFLSADGKEVRFTEPAAMEGLRSYFRLQRFMPQVNVPLNEEDIIQLFYERKVACILTGQWMVNDIIGTPKANLLSQMGASLPPAPPFVGGTHLVLMQHLHPRYEQSAIDLITHLVSKEFAYTYSAITGYFFPIRGDLLDIPQVTTNPFAPLLFQALQIGRTLPAATRWGIVEDALAREFVGIQSDIKQYPSDPLEHILERRLGALAKRLNRTLAV